MPLPLGIYRFATSFLQGFAERAVKSRVAKGKEHPERWPERLGTASVARPAGTLVWFHGVSVGESLSALPVIDRLRAERPDVQVLLTTATTTSADILSKRLPPEVIHQFAPVDTPKAVEAFLDHWQPDMAVFIESDLWPNLLIGLSERKVPTVLISARITEKTARGWRMMPSSVRQLLQTFAVILPQDEASEARLNVAGVRTNGRANLKTLGTAPPVDMSALEALRQQIGDRFIWLAASTHAGEEAIIARTLEGYIRDGDLLIIAPRHPARAADIRADMEALGHTVAQRSLGEAPTSAQVYLADTLGEMGTLFTLSDLIIMGGSFVPGPNGHNPLEPARLAKSVITGPDIANWASIYDDLLAAQATFRVGGPQELSLLAQHLRQNPQAVRAAGQAAFAVSRRDTDTLERVWQALSHLLPERGTS